MNTENKEIIFERALDIESLIVPGKALVIYGPRQVGKTTLVERFLSKTTLKYKYETGDSILLSELFSSRDKEKILSFVEGYDLLVIDEAQRVDNIGLGIKIILDARKDFKVILTGSSSFSLSQNIGDTLTGRKRVKILYPISHFELNNIYNKFELKEKLNEFLRFGFYPEVLASKNEDKKKEALEEIVDSYLLKDVLQLEKIKKSNTLLKLLRLLALQVGSEVSFHELGNKLELEQRTVERYIDILEKAFIVKHLSAYSNNLRKEITRKGKIYFYDLGVRNALINNFNPPELRLDAGALWENFLFMERMKRNEYKKTYANYYFWRTWDKKEVDLVEEREGKLFGYEFKYNTKKLPKAPKDWIETYKNASYEVITPENYLGFVM